jgi:F-type H+-transporting ATPase subunit b
MELEIALVISQILAFLVLLWIMKKFAWKPFQKTLENRRQTIEDAFKSIEQQKLEMEELKKSLATQLDAIDATAKKKIEEAIQKGDQLAQHIQSEAQNQARSILEKTKHEISLELARVQEDLKKQVVNLVIETTGKLLGEKVEAAQDQNRVAQFLKEVKLK